MASRSFDRDAEILIHKLHLPRRPSANHYCLPAFPPLAGGRNISSAAGSNSAQPSATYLVRRVSTICSARAKAPAWSYGRSAAMAGAAVGSGAVMARDGGGRSNAAEHISVG